ncbi:MAG: hypothetical protein O7A98_07945 [Acidobacteria bacterium]|nr:hypothetical protein [Acidobacteriota bacterium]
MEIPTGTSTINIRNFSVKCGNCDTYQTLSHFEPRGEWSVYTYLCENEICDPAVTKTLIEVPKAIDEFANRDPGWRGGGRHGEYGEESS